MKKRYLAISGFISYAAIEFVSTAYAYAAGRLETTIAQTHLLRTTIALCVMVGLFGSLIGMFFAAFNRVLPTLTIFSKGIIYFVLVTLLFSLLKGATYILSFDCLFSLVISTIAGALFVWLYLKLNPDQTKQPKRNVRNQDLRIDNHNGSVMVVP